MEWEFTHTEPTDNLAGHEEEIFILKEINMNVSTKWTVTRCEADHESQRIRFTPSTGGCDETTVYESKKKSQQRNEEKEKEETDSRTEGQRAENADAPLSCLQSEGEVFGPDGCCLTMRTVVPCTGQKMLLRRLVRHRPRSLITMQTQPFKKPSNLIHVGVL